MKWVVSRGIGWYETWELIFCLYFSITGSKLSSMYYIVSMKKAMKKSKIEGDNFFVKNGQSAVN